MSKTTYEYRKKNGICVRCGKNTAIQGKVMCGDCAEEQKIYHKETREYLKSMGMCPRCGKNKLFGDEKECPECVAIMYELNKKSRANRKFDSSEWYKADIKRLKEQGLCRSCRKRKVATGHTYCPICLEKKRNRGKMYRRNVKNIEIPRSERPSYGLCYICGNPLDRDGTICLKCSETMTNNLPKIHSNSKWKSDNKLIFRQ